MEKKITIFTDGAAKGNPGRGGYAAVIDYGGTVRELGAAKSHTTNNEMELQAVVAALETVKPAGLPVSIYTDSKYVVEGAKSWVFGWAKNGWVTKSKTDVLNKELWQALLPLLGAVDIVWHKVPGHVGIIGNERADTIASDLAEGKSVSLYNGPKNTYSLNIDDTSYDEAKAKERSDARKRQALPAYSYVSMVDGVVKIHKTWKECEARVKGKPGARFKKSLDADNEREIITDFKGR